MLAPDEANRQADAVARRLDGGTVIIYAGPRPADVTDALAAAHRRLVTIPLADPSAPPAVDGTINFFPCPPAPILADGRVTFFRAVMPAGAAVFQGSAGPAADDPADNPDLIVPNPLRAGDTFRLASFFYRADRGAT